MDLRTRGIRLRRSSAGIAQSAMVGLLVTVALTVSLGVVAAGASVGSAIAQLWECSLAGAVGHCAAADEPGSGGNRGRGLTEQNTLAAPVWETPAYNETVSTPVTYVTHPGNSGGGGLWRPRTDLDPVPMDWCSGALPYRQTPFGANTASYCVDGDGGVKACTSQWQYSWLGGAHQDNVCASAAIPLPALRCVADGIHPQRLTCTLRPAYDSSGRFFHCTPQAGQLAGYASCTDADHDADDHLAVPVACAVTADPTGSVPCIGKNGTLYNCHQAGNEHTCVDGGRNIDPATNSLSGCRTTPGEKPGTSVQCTWTAARTGCALPGSGSDGGCPAYVTTVQCAVSPADGVYNHCADLGGLGGVPADGFGRICLHTDARGACTQTAAIPLSATPGPAEVTVDTGLGADYTIHSGLAPAIELPDGAGGTLTTDYAGATAYCTKDPEGCAGLVDARMTAVQGSVTDLLVRTGACSSAADCARQLTALTDPAGLSNKGRCPLAIGNCVPRLPARLHLSTTKKGFLAVAGFVAAATGVQFAGTDLIGTVLSNSTIRPIKTLAVGALAATTGGVILALVTVINNHFARKAAAEAAGGGGSGGDDGDGGDGPGGPAQQAAQLQFAGSAQATVDALLADPAALAQLQAALAQPVNPQGAAAAQQVGVNVEMANLAGLAQQAGEIQPADEQQVEEDIETGGGAGVCPADQGGGGGGAADQQAYVVVGLQVIGGGPCG